MANIKTILLSGTEQEIIIAGNNCDIRNDSADTIYAANRSGVTAGEDGVLSIPAGQAAKLLDINGTVYLLGSGSVQLCGNDYSEPVFKSAAAAGGGTEDAVARNAISTLTVEVTENTDDLTELRSCISNHNLLLNPDLTVNQYGTTTVEVSASDYSYICDRWKAKAASGTGIVTYENGNVTLGAGCAMIQRLENAASLNGMTLALSAMVNGELISGSFVWDAAKNYAAVTNGTVLLAYSGNARYIQVYNTSASNAVISSVKLEIGTAPTVHIPTIISEELAKCQRYYQVHTTGDIDPVDLRPSMAEITDIVQREDGNYGYIAEL